MLDLNAYDQKIVNDIKREIDQKLDRGDEQFEIRFSPYPKELEVIKSYIESKNVNILDLKLIDKNCPYYYDAHFFIVTKPLVDFKRIEMSFKEI